MIGYNNLGKWFVATQDYMTTLLAFYIKSSFYQRLDAVFSRYLGQTSHTATSIAWKRSSGTGKPSSSRAAI